ncbi:MAG: hypothetical protein Q7R90_01100 [bacterium]|nr:hypothetical protein [bacterium]
MAGESFEPKLPFFREDGKVSDERIAREMADAELSPDLAHRVVPLFGERAAPLTKEGAIERAGDDFYKVYGIEIPVADVPPHLRTLFEHTYEDQMFRKLEGAEDVEFRKLERDGGVQYLMLYDFKRKDDAWHCFLARAAPDGMSSSISFEIIPAIR